MLSGGYSVPVLSPRPYHAFIAPAKIGTGSTSQGFGRTVTLSEIGFGFICNADGSLGTFANPVASGQPPTTGPQFLHAGK